MKKFLKKKKLNMQFNPLKKKKMYKYQHDNKLLLIWVMAVMLF